jgi:hypothetical protein
VVGGDSMGGTEEALDVIDEALHGSDHAEERCAAELMRIKGNLLFPDYPEQKKVGASILRQSLAEAQGPEELAWERRTSMRLAPLPRGEKLDRTTWQLPFPRYGRLTPGFMTADLVEAKRLLGEPGQACSDGPGDLRQSVRANEALSSTALDIRHASQLGRSII